MSLFHSKFTPLQPYTKPIKNTTCSEAKSVPKTEIDLHFAFTRAIDDALNKDRDPEKLSLRLGQLILDAINKKPIADVDDPIGLYTLLCSQNAEILQTLHNTYLTANNF